MWRGGGHLPPPPKFPNVRIRADVVWNLGNLLLLFFCLSIMFAGSTCGISRTPHPMLEYRTDFEHAAPPKVHKFPPPPPVQFSGLAGIRAWIHDSGKTGQQCVCPPKKLTGPIHLGAQFSHLMLLSRMNSDILAT